MSHRKAPTGPGLAQGEDRPRSAIARAVAAVVGFCLGSCAARRRGRARCRRGVLDLRRGPFPVEFRHQCALAGERRMAEARARVRKRVPSLQHPRSRGRRSDSGTRRRGDVGARQALEADRAQFQSVANVGEFELFPAPRASLPVDGGAEAHRSRTHRRRADHSRHRDRPQLARTCRRVSRTRCSGSSLIGLKLDEFARPLNMVSDSLEQVLAGRPSSFSWRVLTEGKAAARRANCAASSRSIRSSISTPWSPGREPSDDPPARRANRGETSGERAADGPCRHRRRAIRKHQGECGPQRRHHGRDRRLHPLAGVAVGAPHPGACRQSGGRPGGDGGDGIADGRRLQHDFDLFRGAVRRHRRRLRHSVQRALSRRTASARRLADGHPAAPDRESACRSPSPRSRPRRDSSRFFRPTKGRVRTRA